MGISLFGNSYAKRDPGGSGYDQDKPNIESKRLPNPDPHNFTIIKTEQIGYVLVVKIKYPDCTNYEGNKILVYKCTLDELMNQTELDPHFCDDTSHIYPYARFKPTAYGWDLAIRTAKMINNDIRNDINISYGVF